VEVATQAGNQKALGKPQGPEKGNRRYLKEGKNLEMANLLSDTALLQAEKMEKVRGRRAKCEIWIWKEKSPKREGKTAKTDEGLKRRSLPASDGRWAREKSSTAGRSRVKKNIREKKDNKRKERPNALEAFAKLSLTCWTCLFNLRVGKKKSRDGKGGGEKRRNDSLHGKVFWTADFGKVREKLKRVHQGKSLSSSHV